MTKHQIKLLMHIVGRKYEKWPIVCLYELDQSLVTDLARIVIEQYEALESYKNTKNAEVRLPGFSTGGVV